MLYTFVLQIHSQPWTFILYFQFSLKFWLITKKIFKNKSTMKELNASASNEGTVKKTKKVVILS